jgi:hypothetical protein
LQLLSTDQCSASGVDTEFRPRRRGVFGASEFDINRRGDGATVRQAVGDVEASRSIPI